jgi:hypothetical protein
MNLTLKKKTPTKTGAEAMQSLPARRYGYRQEAFASG